MIHRHLSGSLYFGLFCLLALGMPLLAQEADPQQVFQNPLQRDDPAFKAVTAMMQATPILRASFKQDKRIKALRRPLISSGEFLFASKVGVQWHTLVPFDTLFVITDKGIKQQSADNKPQIIQASAQPMIATFTKVFMALFGGDTSELQSTFKVYFQGTAEDWAIGLEPKSMVMGKMIDRIILTGGSHLGSIHFLEASGDHSVIHFENVRVAPTDLTIEEQARFEF